MEEEIRKVGDEERPKKFVQVDEQVEETLQQEVEDAVMHVCGRQIDFKEECISEMVKSVGVIYGRQIHVGSHRSHPWLAIGNLSKRRHMVHIQHLVKSTRGFTRGCELQPAAKQREIVSA